MSFRCLVQVVSLSLALALVALPAEFSAAAELQVPLHGLFELTLVNQTTYDNPFADVELNAKFFSPSSRIVEMPGYFDGDGQGGQVGHVWKQRFMPDEVGRWIYVVRFSDGSPGVNGWFECVAAGARPGPWRSLPENPRWFTDSLGEPFLPVSFHANAMFTPPDPVTGACNTQ